MPIYNNRAFRIYRIPLRSDDLRTSNLKPWAAGGFYSSTIAAELSSILRSRPDSPRNILPLAVKGITKNF
jgi:hypothetical protein